MQNNVVAAARLGCRVELAFGEWLRASPLHVLATALGGLPGDMTAFWCPRCQAPILSGDRPATEWPSARLILDLCETRSDSREFVCDKCHLQGTRWRLARACLESPVVFRELFKRRLR